MKDCLRFYGKILRKAMSISDAKKTLGFPPTSNPSHEEIMKAYKSLAFKMHPDRGGDPTKMVEINVAKDVMVGKQAPTVDRPYGPSTSPSYSPYTEYTRRSPYTTEEEGRPYEPPKKKEVTWDEAKIKEGVPTSGVSWKFRTSSISKNLDSETTNGYADYFVVYGRSERSHIFVAVKHEVYQSLYEHVDNDTYWMKHYEYPLTQKLKDLAGKAIKKAFDDMKPEGKKFNNKAAKLALNADFKSVYIDKTSYNLVYIPLKDLLVELGELDASDPKLKNRKLIVTIEVRSKPGSLDDLMASLDINGKIFKLKDTDVTSMGGFKPRSGFLNTGKGVLHTIFGDYYHQGGKKVLTRAKEGKKILEWMSAYLDIPEDVKVQLKAAADQMK
jgi:hypothetical protein